MDICKKKQKKVDSESPLSSEEGDTYLFNCLKRDSYLFVAFSVGKRTEETCREMMETLFERTVLPSPKDKLDIFSDGLEHYTTIIAENYADTCVNYGQLVKTKEKGRIVNKKKKIVFGEPTINEIETTDIENFNGILRGKNSRLVRKTKCFSKNKCNLIKSLHIDQFYWNMMNPLSNGDTPAMKEAIACHQWSWKDFFNFRLSIV